LPAPSKRAVSPARRVGFVGFETVTVCIALTGYAPLGYACSHSAVRSAPCTSQLKAPGLSSWELACGRSDHVLLGSPTARAAARCRPASGIPRRTPRLQLLSGDALGAREHRTHGRLPRPALLRPGLRR